MCRTYQCARPLLCKDEENSCRSLRLVVRTYCSKRCAYDARGIHACMHVSFVVTFKAGIWLKIVWIIYLVTLTRLELRPYNPRLYNYQTISIPFNSFTRSLLFFSIHSIAAAAVMGEVDIQIHWVLIGIFLVANTVLKLNRVEKDEGSVYG